KPRALLSVSVSVSRLDLDHGPHALVPGEVVPAPVHEHAEPVAEPDQLEEVEAKPRQPRQPAPEPDAQRQLGHRRAPPDGGHRPAVEVAEPAAGPARDAAPDLARGVAAL